MECSWKTVLLLVCASLGVQYTAIRTLRDSLSGPCQSVYQCQNRRHRESNWRTLCDESWMSMESPRKHILLFATTRSGSSFTGQLLNQHPEIFYMFEPLYHIQQAFTNSSGRMRRSLDRRALLGAYRDLLLNLYNCDLRFMESYIRPEPQDHVTNSFFRRSSSHALCSPPVCLEGGEGATPDSPEESWCTKKCGGLNLTLASKSCLSRGQVAIKTVRIPEVGDLRTLAEDPRLDLKIIHLVRDPRAILASRMTAFSDQFRAWKIWNATGRQPRYVDLSQITSTCKDMVASAEAGLRRPTWLQGRYRLVRYEDLAFNPKHRANELYQFIGLEMEDRVQTWIERNTNSNLSAPFEWNYKYSTTRDSRMTAESWRLRLGYDIVRTVQNLCNDTLALLGYKRVRSAAQLRNLSYSLVEPVTFQPNLSQTWVTTKNGQGFWEHGHLS
ncbi:carbohydrate sulfotransferase 1-like isoform X1 [Phyllopteryx taeniolatus]|uniref:carbohydrate sulfotransferase 1-like isoform X1 n=1 Tax=Phyllopteryx taeniolatus TaxID=161469 RepID=UPI002AD4846C|nr:carbohydrate sulfotransferase 1-like isoform X1 [Phyllopteryx taeniolatus]XP_061628437.1 carbohydrate sulfotransferase 1-like isoform X1 [Phyllopteryx taeniolatus]XP_061628438.1 carbohydrate sulfotransferase 1-like isoform X1 [Phyllopteryx taeniolatus]